MSDKHLNIIFARYLQNVVPGEMGMGLGVRRTPEGWVVVAFEPDQGDLPYHVHADDDTPLSEALGLVLGHLEEVASKG